jgi:hypothetical protein
MDRLDDTLRAIRSEMRHRGMVLPKLDSDIAAFSRVGENDSEVR